MQAIGIDVYFDDGQIGAGVGADNFGLGFGVIGEDDGDADGVGDNMVIGNDVAFGIVDKAGTLALLGDVLEFLVKIIRKFKRLVVWVVWIRDDFNGHGERAVPFSQNLNVHHGVVELVVQVNIGLGGDDVGGNVLRDFLYGDVALGRGVNNPAVGAGFVRNGRIVCSGCGGGVAAGRKHEAK